VANFRWPRWGDRVRRREFIGLVGGASAWPFIARAQQVTKVPTIGFLGAGVRSVWSNWVAAFAEGMRAHGWVDGATVVIDYRWAEGRRDRYAEIAGEFVRLKVDVIVTAGGAAVIALKQATPKIPIVFAAAGDPVGSGLVTSLARPGGNVTGLSIQAPDLAGKRLELFRELVPALRRLAIMGNAGAPGVVLEMRESLAAARTLGLEATMFEIRQADEIEPAISSLKGRVDGLCIPPDPLMTTHRLRINTLTLEAQIPTVFSFRENVEAGGLLSYGPSMPHLFRRAADLVDKILRGGKPADLPVEQPTKYELFINLKTAKVLGLAVPPSLLARADEVIE
jgi:putative ABC transport system substrate-binding protein